MAIAPAPYPHPGAPPDPPELPEGVTGAGRRPPWAAWTAPVALVAGLLTAVVVAIILTAISGKVKDPPPAVLIGGTVFQDAALIGSALLFARIYAKPRAWMFGLRRTRFWPAFGWMMLVWFCYFVFTLIYVVALGVGGESDKLPQELGADESTVALVAVAVLVTVIAPIAEELFFRGYFFTAVGNAKRPWLAVSLATLLFLVVHLLGAPAKTLIPIGLLAIGLGVLYLVTRSRRNVGWPWLAAITTGMVFGSIHAGSAPGEFLVPLGVFGFGLCVLYWRTRSLYPCMALHALNNSLAFGISVSWDWEIPLVMIGSNLVIAALMLPLDLRSRVRTA